MDSTNRADDVDAQPMMGIRKDDANHATAVKRAKVTAATATTATTATSQEQAATMTGSSNNSSSKSHLLFHLVGDGKATVVGHELTMTAVTSCSGDDGPFQGRVFYRPKSAKERGKRGSIVASSSSISSTGAAAASATATNATKVLVHFDHDITPRMVSKKRLVPLFGTESTLSLPPQSKDTAEFATASSSSSSLSIPSLSIVVTAQTAQYRLLAQSQVLGSQDSVLEIGCSTGMTSKILLQHKPAHWIGLDTSPSMIQSVQSTLLATSPTSTTPTEDAQPQPQQQGCMSSRYACHVVDALTEPDRAQQVAGSPTVVFLDIGGNRHAAAVLRMLQWIVHSFPAVPYSSDNHASGNTSCVGGSTGAGNNDQGNSPLLRLVVVKSEELFERLHEIRRLQSCSKRGDPDESGISVMSNTLHITNVNVKTWFRDELARAGMLQQQQQQQDGPSDSSSSFTNMYRVLPKHPLQAPKRTSPTDGNTLICRYHNYHTQGCRKHKDGLCELDHLHCHLCLQPGHIALQCTTRILTKVDVLATPKGNNNNGLMQGGE